MQIINFKTLRRMDGARLAKKPIKTPSYPNIFAPGIAFAPPRILFLNQENHQMEPKFSSATRTGMPSGITAN